MEHKPLLVSPNVAVATSLGSFFHLLSAPIFLLANFTASKILIAGSILGVITTLAIYKTGKELGGLFVGRAAAFLYSASFLVAFSDRRWWPLSPDPLLAVLAIFSIAKIIKGRYLYSLLLAVSASFAWHADPSLGVIIVFAMLSVIVFKIPLLKKRYLPALVYLLFSAAPFFIFELRHPGAITHPLLELLSRLSGHTNKFLDLFGILQGFSRSLFLTPGDTMEKYFSYSKYYPAPLFSPLPEVITALFFLFPLWRRSGQAVKILYLYILSFFLGVVVFTLGMGSIFHQHYFVVVWPAFFLLIALTLQKIPRVLVFVFLAAFLLSNLMTIVLSSMRYPLLKKEQMVNVAMESLSDKQFALKIIDDKGYFGGFGGLFYLRNKFPINSDYYHGWDWVYRAYSLYEVQTKSGLFETTVIISPNSKVEVKSLVQ